ncbi:ABC transporter permease [Patescibacteria group bacterium]|nr:ABC transporter permease [Patescibacteria group bacterium]
MPMKETIKASQHTIKLALGNLRRNRLRTILSMLGVMIGVFSVTLIVSLGFGLKSYIIGQVEQFGKNFVTVNAKVPELSQQGSIMAQTSGNVVSIDYDDLEDLAKVPHVLQSVGFVADQALTSRGSEELTTFIFGATGNYLDFDLQTKIANGRFFTEREERAMKPYVVIGSKVAEKLFGQDDPVGQKIRVRNLNLEVIGVTKPRGAVAFFDFDKIILIPLKLAQKRLTGSDYLQEIDLIVSETKYIPGVVADTERILRRNHGISDPTKDDFMITSYIEVMETIGTVTNAITILLGLLAAVSLLVGGIGIMNIMLVSVTERIREVGLRKALGAKNSIIWQQFLTEAILLTTVGGGLGGLAGSFITIAITAYARYTGFDIKYAVSLSSFLGGLAVAVIVGVIFGSYPAKKAAELDPIQALRYE